MPLRPPYITPAAAASTPGRRDAVVGSAWRSALPRDLHFGLVLALTIRGLAVTSYAEMRRVAGLAEELHFDSIWLCDHFLTLAPDAYVEDAGIAGRADGNPPRRARRARCRCSNAGRALRARPRHAAAPPRHQRALPLLPVACRARQDGGHPRRDQRGAARPGAGRRAGSSRSTAPTASRSRASASGSPSSTEGVEVIRRMWTEPHPRFQGRHYAIDDAVCDPPPLQRPHPPDLDRRRGRPGAPGGRARGRRRQRALVGPVADRRARRLSRRGVPRVRPRSGRPRALGHRAAHRRRATPGGPPRRASASRAIPGEGHVVGHRRPVRRPHPRSTSRPACATSSSRSPTSPRAPRLELAGREVLPALRQESAVT